jgi:phosphoglycolate phosphatase
MSAPDIDGPRFELIVFDWDGTLVDSTAAIAESIRGAARDLDLPVPPLSVATHVIGLGLQDMLDRTVPDLRREQWPAFIDRYRHHFLAQEGAARPFDGIPELLQALSALGRPLAVATGKSRKGLDAALAHAGWNRHFAATRCADEGAPKPDPWMLLDLCRELGVAPSQTVMIGDTSHDLKMARDAGAHAIGVLYGAHSADELRAIGASACVDSVDALRNWLWPRVAGRSAG